MSVLLIFLKYLKFSSVTQSCPPLCDPMDCSTPGLPVHHHLPKFIQTHVHWVGDAIQPYHPLSSPSPPAFNLSQHQGLFKWVSFRIRWPKYWNFSFSISSSNEYSGLISFRMDLVWFPCSPRDSQESSPTPQFKLFIFWIIKLKWFHNFKWIKQFIFLINVWLTFYCNGRKFMWRFSHSICSCTLSIPLLVVAVQLLSHVWLFATPWTAARQASLSFTASWSFLKLMSIESVLASNHLILYCPLLLLPWVFPSIRVFSNESALRIR